MFYNYIFQHKNEQLTEFMYIFVKNNDYGSYILRSYNYPDNCFFGNSYT